MLDLHSSIDQMSKADDTYFTHLHSAGACDDSQEDMKDFFYVHEDSQCSSSATEAGLTNSRMTGSSGGAYIMEQQQTSHDPRLINIHSWKHSNALPPRGPGIDVHDSRGAMGLNTAIDAIDKIIGPKKTKPKPRPKQRTERIVYCEKCGTTFTSVGNLNRHRRVSHQGVRVFCDFKGCKQSFSQAADLSRHRRRVHMCFTKLEQYHVGTIRSQQQGGS